VGERDSRDECELWKPSRIEYDEYDDSEGKYEKANEIENGARNEVERRGTFQSYQSPQETVRTTSPTVSLSMWSGSMPIALLLGSPSRVMPRNVLVFRTGLPVQYPCSTTAAWLQEIQILVYPVIQHVLSRSCVSIYPLLFGITPSGLFWKLSHTTCTMD
jgi:hypothetical protein